MRSQLAVWVDWLPSADTFYIDRKTLSAAQGKLDERLKDSPLMLTMIEWCRSAAKDGGSPGRIRTSDMTVNSRPLYRLSYRGVVSEILLLSAWHREIKRWRIDIIASEYVCESIARIIGT